MVFDIDVGTMFMIAATIVGAFWGLVKLMFVQYEKRQELRFDTLGKAMQSQKDELSETMTEQGRELDAHMAKQDATIAEVRRVESASFAEIRRVENELNQCRIDAAKTYMTKDEARGRHQEILDAIQALGNRIDAIHGRSGVTQ
jgi:small-conductance mechanosensitive channel